MGEISNLWIGNYIECIIITFNQGFSMLTFAPTNVKPVLESYIKIHYRKETVGGKDTYTYDSRYWELRKDPGFMKMTLPKLW